MSHVLVLTALQLVNVLLVPLLLAGWIRKVKAWMQNRSGPPLLQPWHDLAKQLHKSQTISGNASWMFSLAPMVALAIAACAAVLVPWNSVLLPVNWDAASNFLLVLYLLALSRFIALLAALDTGSAFGGLGASREGAISVMVEPILVLALSAVALSAGSMDLSAMYSAPASPWLAAAAGTALLLAALAELSRMPVDDPTTHLELTMIHEAMILEYSGPGLAAIEYGVALRTCIFLGLALQTLLRVWPEYGALPVLSRYAAGLTGLAVLGLALGVVEGVWVKLNWRKIPNYMGYAAVLGVLAVLIAAVQA